MKPLLVLLSVFVVAVVVLKIVKHKHNLPLAARIAMSFMLIFTAIGHFTFTKGMTMMLPDFIPFKIAVVYGTGLIEIAAAIGLLIPGFRVVTAWLLILFFMLIIPANIEAALENINIETGNLDGSGTSYLWFRIPLQLLFIVWTYLSAIRIYAMR
jgi:uncharacterized membrane protein